MKLTHAMAVCTGVMSEDWGGKVLASMEGVLKRKADPTTAPDLEVDVDDVLQCVAGAWMAGPELFAHSVALAASSSVIPTDRSSCMKHSHQLALVTCRAVVNGALPRQHWRAPGAVRLRGR